MLNVIQHPESFKEGARVLHLLSRNKDVGTKARTVLKVSHSVEQFDRRFDQLMSYAEPGQRIYCSAEPRDVSKAIRSFKIAQLDADYDQETERFYRSLESRWATALMKPANAVKDSKLWLIDCDTPKEYDMAKHELAVNYDRGAPYEYKSKSGNHIMVQPFNMTRCFSTFQKMVHKNALMLWAY